MIKIFARADARCYRYNVQIEKARAAVLFRTPGKTVVGDNAST